MVQSLLQAGLLAQDRLPSRSPLPGAKPEEPPGGSRAEGDPCRSHPPAPPLALRLEGSARRAASLGGLGAAGDSLCKRGFGC